MERLEAAVPRADISDLAPRRRLIASTRQLLCRQYLPLRQQDCRQLCPVDIVHRNTAALCKRSERRSDSRCVALHF